MRLFARKRKVRVHYRDEESSLDGIYVGTACGHYVIAKPAIVGEASTVQVDGEVWVPRERVLFLQVTS